MLKPNKILVFILIIGLFAVSCDRRPHGELVVSDMISDDPTDDVELLAELEQGKQTRISVPDISRVSLTDEVPEVEPVVERDAADSLMSVTEYKDMVTSIEDLTLPAVCDATGDYVTGTQWFYVVNYVALLCLCVLALALVLYVFFVIVGSSFWLMCHIIAAAIATAHWLVSRGGRRKAKGDEGEKVDVEVVVKRRERRPCRLLCLCRAKKDKPAVEIPPVIEQPVPEAAPGAPADVVEEVPAAEVGEPVEVDLFDDASAPEEEEAGGQYVGPADGGIITPDPEIFTPDEDDYVAPPVSDQPLVFPFINLSAPWNREGEPVLPGFMNCQFMRLASGDNRFVIVCDEPVPPSFAEGLKALFDQDCRMDDFRSWIGHPECFFRFPEGVGDRFYLDYTADGNAGTVTFFVYASIDDVMSGARLRFMQALKTNLALDRLRYPEIPGLK